LCQGAGKAILDGRQYCVPGFDYGIAG